MAPNFGQLVQWKGGGGRHNGVHIPSGECAIERRGAPFPTMQKMAQGFSPDLTFSMYVAER